MPLAINTAVVGFSIVALGFCVWDALGGNRRRAIVSAGALIAFLILLGLTTGFPFPGNGQMSFGGGIPTLWCVVLMFLGIILGCVAQAIWNAKRKFSWRDFVRPIVVSPILLLPLLASLPADSIEPVQLVAVSILAFQNGFFWQQVLRDAKPTTTAGAPASDA
jgi:hypothetical protein